MNLGPNEYEPRYPDYPYKGNKGNTSVKKAGKAILIGFVILVLGIFLVWIIWQYQVNTFTVRVEAQSSGSAVPRATVILIVEGQTFSAASNSEGIATFDDLPASREKVNLIVEHQQYQVYDTSLSLQAKEFRVLLDDKDPLVGKIIVRILDKRDRNAVVGAGVVLFVEGAGEVRSQPADSNGITRFNIDFQPNTGKADVNIRVEAAGYEVNQQRLTLLVNSLQDIRLDSNNHTLSATYFDSELSTELLPVTTTPTLAQPSPDERTYLLKVNGYLESEEVCVSNGETLSIQATGRIRVGSYVGDVGPEGTERGLFDLPIGDGYDLVLAFPHAALMFMINGEGQWRGYHSGQSRTFEAPLDGCLVFDINDKDPGNNSQADFFEVEVRVTNNH